MFPLILTRFQPGVCDHFDFPDRFNGFQIAEQEETVGNG